MANTTAGRTATKLGIASALVLGTAAALVSIGSGTANAEEIRTDPRVSSRQAASSSDGGVRHDATWGEVRSADILDVHAHGEVKESLKAVPSKPRGHRADGFRGGWHNGMRGSW